LRGGLRFVEHREVFGMKENEPSRERPGEEP